RRPSPVCREDLTMSDEASVSSADYMLLTRLADEFAARYRAGERPSLQEYIDRHPALAEDIREMFPAMVEIEQVKDDRQGAAGPGGAGRSGAGQDRRLRAPPRGGPGRHGGRLRGRAGLARPPRGAEGPAPPGGAGRDDPRAVPPRGAGGGPAAPHQHRPGLRGWPEIGRASCRERV